MAPPRARFHSVPCLTVILDYTRTVLQSTRQYRINPEALRKKTELTVKEKWEYGLQKEYEYNIRISLFDQKSRAPTSKLFDLSLPPAVLRSSPRLSRH